MISRRLRGRIIDLETALEPGDESHFHGLPSTPTQVTLVEIMNAIYTIETKVDHLTERMDKVEDQLQTIHRDTDEYVESQNVWCQR